MRHMQNNERWLTFDCFGTLVSWQRGFVQILRGVVGDRSEELAAAYHEFEPRVQAGPYRSYKEVLAIALQAAARKVDIALADDDLHVLARRWDEQPVFDDVGPALREAREAGWRLAALTNCDNDLFARTQATLPVAFDLVVTAQDVRSYKPALLHFARFRELTGVPRERWVHVACSWYHDIVPAQALGLRRVWIDRDRTGEDPSSASYVQPSLAGLAETVERCMFIA
ncbi:MAG: HAD family hydrolase [Vulcanimicrobiaceae bacterium]